MNGHSMADPDLSWLDLLAGQRACAATAQGQAASAAMCRVWRNAAPHQRDFEPLDALSEHALAYLDSR